MVGSSPIGDTILYKYGEVFMEYDSKKLEEDLYNPIYSMIRITNDIETALCSLFPEINKLDFPNIGFALHNKISENIKLFSDNNQSFVSSAISIPIYNYLYVLSDTAISNFVIYLSKKGKVPFVVASSMFLQHAYNKEYKKVMNIYNDYILLYKTVLNFNLFDDVLNAIQFELDLAQQCGVDDEDIKKNLKLYNHDLSLINSDFKIKYHSDTDKQKLLKKKPNC